MLTFLGDVFLKNPVSIEVDLPGGVVFNLEAPLTDAEHGYPRKINLKADPDNLDATFTTTPLAVNLANNHILDFFENGLESTLAALDARGVQHFGAGSSQDNHGNPLIVECDQVRVALLGYADQSSNAVFSTDGQQRVAELHLDSVVADVAAARAAGAQRVVVSVHWGHEQVALPAVNHVVLARQIVDAGADIIVGHHSHCIQGFETYGGKPIFYGLGNCIFPPHKSASYFNENGVSTKTVDSRPAPWNRTSLAVNWSPVTGAFTVKPLMFVNNRLVAASFSISSFRLNISSLESYERRFNRAFRWGRLRHTLARFASQPKLPRLRHLKGVTKELRSVPPT